MEVSRFNHTAFDANPIWKPPKVPFMISQASQRTGLGPGLNGDHDYYITLENLSQVWARMGPYGPVPGPSS